MNMGMEMFQSILLRVMYPWFFIGESLGPDVVKSSALEGS